MNCANRKTPLVIHVPHASVEVPGWAREPFLVDHQGVLEEASISADLFTDRLAQEAWPDADIVAAELSRIVVDVERYSDDAIEEMAAVGRGVIYTHDHLGNRIKRNLLSSEREYLLRNYYLKHVLFHLAF